VVGCARRPRAVSIEMDTRRSLRQHGKLSIELDIRAVLLAGTACTNLASEVKQGTRRFISSVRYVYTHKCLTPQDRGCGHVPNALAKVPKLNAMMSESDLCSSACSARSRFQ
jgi:hypothetical protein